MTAKEVLAILFILMAPHLASASPVPMMLEGKLLLDGKEAPEGTSIVAMAGEGVIAGVLITKERGAYSQLFIYGDDSTTERAEGAKAGGIISFVISGYNAKENILWEEGSIKTLDLSAGTKGLELEEQRPSGSVCEKPGGEVQLQTDRKAYRPGEIVKVSGLLTYDCRPKSTDEISYQSGISGDRSLESSKDGYFTFTETIPERPEKSYTLKASYGNASEQVTIYVSTCMDADKDGFFEPDNELNCIPTDCNDKDSSANPKAKEVCDDMDNNCDGEIDEGDVCPIEEEDDNYEKIEVETKNITSLMIVEEKSIGSISYIRFIYTGLLFALAAFAVASYAVIRMR